MRLTQFMSRAMGSMQTMGSAVAAGVRPSLRATARGLYSSTGYTVSRTLGKYQPKRLFGAGALEAGALGATAGTLLGAATSSGSSNVSVTTGSGAPPADTNNDTGVTPATASGAIVSEERQQVTEEDTERQIHNVDVIDGAVVNVQLDPPTPQESDGSLESIISWLGREGHYSFFTSMGSICVPYDKTLVAMFADGKLNHYLYYRGDLRVTVRWNAPKTVFGGFVLYWDYGQSDVDSATGGDIARHKVYVDLQASAATLTIPWLFPQRFASLVGDWYIGSVYSRVTCGPTSASEVQWNPRFNVYVSFVNVSLLMPTPLRSMVAQGGVLSSINSTLSFNDMPADAGQDVIRTFSEGINLARSSGSEPAVPIARSPLPMRQSEDPHSPATMLDLTSIPTYVPVPLSTAFQMRNAWLDIFRESHHSLRADFVVTLHCHATAFHSGRVRILYSPFLVSFDHSAVFDLVRGPSILWNIDDNKTITFEVPYGSLKEFNDFPYIWLYPEPDFQSGLANDVRPSFVAEIVAFNIAVVGFLAPAPTYVAWFKTPTLVTDKFLGVEAEKQSTLGVSGWYTASHTSENECDTLLVTTARRPGHPNTQVTGRVIVRARDVSLHTFVNQDGWKAVHIWSFHTYIGRVMQCHIGWRGSLKVSVYSTSGAVFKMTMYYSYVSMNTDDFAWQGGTVVTAAGFGEVVIPYFSSDLYYTTVENLVNAETVNDSPIVVIDSSNSDPYMVYVSFMPDFELIGTRSRELGTGLDKDSFLEEKASATRSNPQPPAEVSTTEGTQTPSVFDTPPQTARQSFMSTNVQGN